jgi:hypothetical protein
LAVSAVLGAQAPVVLADGNATFSYQSFPSSPSSTTGFANFAAAAANHLYQSWWYYAVAGDAAGTAFSTAGGQMTVAPSADGRAAALEWADADGRGFGATLTTRVYATGADSGVVAQAMTITNNTGSPLSLHLYSYSDLDVAGAAGDAAAQQASWPAGNHQVQDSSGARCWAMALDFHRFEVGTFPTVRDKVLAGVAGAPFVPGNAGLPFAAGDHSAVFSWLLTLAPSARATCHMLLAIAQVPASQRVASAATFCVAKPGTHGIAAWDLDPPCAGATARLRITNGFAGAIPIALLGLTPSAVPIAGLGTLCCAPAATLSLPSFAATRVSVLAIPLPAAARLDRAPLHWQAFFLDPGAPGSVAHTQGLTWNIGSFAH